MNCLQLSPFSICHEGFYGIPGPGYGRGGSEYRGGGRGGDFRGGGRGGL